MQWTTVDHVAADNGMLYIRGSHHSRTIFKPNAFVSQAPLPGADGLMLPDIEGHLDEFDVVQFDVEPGDVVVHRYRLIHGARGNRSRYQVRRTLSARYCGDDILIKMRPAAPAQLHLKEPLVEGARLGDVLQMDAPRLTAAVEVTLSELRLSAL